VRWWQRAPDEEDAAHILTHNAARVYSRYALKYRLHALGCLQYLIQRETISWAPLLILWHPKTSTMLKVSFSLKAEPTWQLFK
jgi:hypothetical protein